MGLFRRSNYAHLMVSAAVGALTLGTSAAWAQSKPINIPPQALASALNDFGSQTGQQVFFTTDLIAAKVSSGVAGATDEQVALAQILQGTGLTYRRKANAYIIEPAGASDPQSGSAAGDGADQGTVQALIVTAQKREENIQDVPIAMSAFTQESLTRSQVAGGPDLMTQVPNMTFTKTNFSGYSIQIRGIGTQAISATTDPAVAVAFNNTPFLSNHFFEQEFYDLERVEVLRGPQGTLYGRNATAGVVNVISAKPKSHFEAKLSGDLSNYNSSRFEGMVNLPLVEDKAALRIAGAWTKRDGFVKNILTGQQTDGRNLWSARVTLGLTPTDKFTANLIY
jgi:iron complex outermembrane receptor protein